MGLLGAGMASHLAARGDDVVVWNRTRDKALQARGVRVADTPADAVAGASRVHLVLTDDDAVDAVLAALRPGLAVDAVVIDHTTTSPTTTAARALRLRDDGVAFVHAPVFMSPANAHAGRGLMLAAGPKDLVDAVTPPRLSPDSGARASMNFMHSLRFRSLSASFSPGGLSSPEGPTGNGVGLTCRRQFAQNRINR